MWLFLSRGFYWANYATGLGASMHELGHCFDLAHTPKGIMGRGFDDMNCVFTMWKIPPSGNTSAANEESGKKRYCAIQQNFLQIATLHFGNS